MKHLILLLSILLIVGCQKEPDGGLSESERNASLVFDKADVTGAEYLTVTQSIESKSKSSTDDRNVFKIDKDGNMTAVMFCMSYAKGSNGAGQIPKEEVRTDIKVIPEQIVSFGGIDTYFARCMFIDGSGKSIWPDTYSGGPNNPYLGQINFLIRNSDGAVFYDKDGQLSGLIYNNSDQWTTIHSDDKNNMYYSNSSTGRQSDIHKLTVQDKNLAI